MNLKCVYILGNLLFNTNIAYHSIITIAKFEKQMIIKKSFSNNSIVWMLPVLRLPDKHSYTIYIGVQALDYK
jgi:hypothetical protein